MDILKIVESVLAFIFHILPYLAGISAFVFGILFFKQKRYAGEIDNIKELMEAYRKERNDLLERIDKQDKRIQQLEERDNEHRYEIVKKDMEIVDLEGLLVQNKRVLNYGCENWDTTCPIGMKYRELLSKMETK